MSPSEKLAVVIARVPPTTISTDGMLTKDPGEPPSTMAVASRPNPAVRPRIVAASTVVRLRRGPLVCSAIFVFPVGADQRSVLMISVMVTPRRSSTTTTSPRATSRLFT